MTHMQTAPIRPDTSRTYQVSRRHADTLGVDMGRTNFKGPIDAFEEVAANCIDGGGKVIKISVDRSYDGEGGGGQAYVEDDGRGMRDGAGIQQYMDIGGSEKKQAKLEGRLSPEGRDYIGNFGWGTLAPRRLCNVCTVESWAEGDPEKPETMPGKYSVMREVFTDDDKDSDLHDVREGTYEGEKRGTRITFKGLKFLGEEDDFTDTELLARLEDDFDLEKHGIHLYVNGKLAQPFKIVNPTKYEIDIEVDGVKVTGMIYYSSKTLGDRKGISTRVNGRAVGGRNEELFDGIVDAGTHARIRGVLEIGNAMDKEIIFTREFFSRGAKGKKLARAIREEIKKIAVDQNVDRRDEKVEKGREYVAEQLPELGQLVRTALADGDIRSYRFEFDQAVGTLSVDKSARVIHVNPRASLFRPTAYTPKDMAYMLENLSTHAVASALMPDDRSRRLLDKAAINAAAVRLRGSRGKALYLNDLIPQEDGEKEKPVLNTVDTRLYSYREVTERTGKDNALLKRLKNAGLLTEARQGEILGSEAIRLEKSLAGLATLYEAARHTTVPTGTSDFNHRRSTEDMTRRKFNKAKELDERVHLLGGEGKEAIYAVKEADLPEFVSFLDTGSWPAEDADLSAIQGRIDSYDPDAKEASPKVEKPSGYKGIDPNPVFGASRPKPAAPLTVEPEEEITPTTRPKGPTMDRATEVSDIEAFLARKKEGTA